jgi:hypothetical protein
VKSGAVVAIVALAAALAFEARADVSAQDRAAAEALFREGRRLFDNAQFDLACSKLEASWHLDPALGTLLNLALCHDQQGKTATAWSEFLDAQAQARSAGDESRELFARDNASRLEAALSKLRFSLGAEVGGLSLTLDGRSLSAGTWGSSIPVDPGPHEIVVSAPDREPWRHTVAVGKGPIVVELVIPELARKASAPPPAAPKSAPARPAARPAPIRHEPAATSGGSSRVAGLVVGAAGVVALGAGGFFGYRAWSEEKTADERCPDRACSDDRGLEASGSAKTSADVATACVATGVVALGVGVWLWLSSDAPPPASSSAGRRWVIRF